MERKELEKLDEIIACLIICGGHIKPDGIEPDDLIDVRSAITWIINNRAAINYLLATSDIDKARKLVFPDATFASQSHPTP